MDSNSSSTSCRKGLFTPIQIQSVILARNLETKFIVDIIEFSPISSKILFSNTNNIGPNFGDGINFVTCEQNLTLKQG